MTYYMLTTVLDGEMVTTLHATKNGAKNALYEAVSDRADAAIEEMGEVQSFFDEKGVGWNFQITAAELEASVDIPFDFSTYKESMTEAEFYELWNTAQERFSLTGTFFSRKDADMLLEDQYDRPPLTDEQWVALRDSETWERNIAVETTKTGFELIDEELLNQFVW